MPALSSFPKGGPYAKAMCAGGERPSKIQQLPATNSEALHYPELLNGILRSTRVRAVGETV